MGDLADLVCNLTLFDLLSRSNCICKLDLTVGVGDKEDLAIRIKDKWRSVNVKTSLYHPLRPGLNLFVKQEELRKNIDVYVQCFVHLEADPHIHVAGYIPTSSQRWREAIESLIEIPRANHRGVAIPAEELRGLDYLIEQIDRKLLISVPAEGEQLNLALGKTL